MLSSNSRKLTPSGTLIVAPPITIPVPSGVQQSHIQEHQIASSEISKGSKIEEMTNIELSIAKEKTPMCLVNELARHNKIEHQYRLTGEEGPAHKKRFTVTLRLGTEEYTAEGPSIKKAQHSAASVALQHTNYRHPPPKNLKQQNRPGKGNITPTVELNALAMKRGEPTTYTVVEMPPTPPHNNFNHYHRGMYTQTYNEPYGGYQYNSNYRGKQNYRSNSRNPKYGFQNSGSPANNKGFKMKVKVGDREFVGEGATSQAARHDAASKALNILRELPVNPVSTINLQPAAESGVEMDSSSELKSPISLVHEIALKRGMTVSFDVVSEKGPPHMRTFVTKCTVGEYEATSEGNGKKISKKRAAEKMLEQLRKLPPMTPTTTNTNPNRMKRKGTQNKKKPRNLIKETKVTTESNQPKESEKQDGESITEEMNPISRLIQIQQAKKEKEPVYILKEERGAPRKREFLIQVSVGDVSYVGSGPNKKIAKRNAAEGLLQVLGYSSSTIGRDGAPLSQSQPTAEQPPASAPGGPKGRQIVPGLLLMNDKPPSSTNPHSGVSLKTTAAAAKEYLSSQAAAAKENEVPTIRPSEQLDYLAQILNFKVQYTDFRKGSQNEFLSLVSLSTDPPQVCHGSGPSMDISKDQAALSALRSFAEIGLDSITTPNKKSDTLATNVTINATGLNASASAQELYLGNSIPTKDDSFLNGK